MLYYLVNIFSINNLEDCSEHPMLALHWYTYHLTFCSFIVNL